VVETSQGGGPVEQAGKLASLFKVPQGATDTSHQMFNLVDDITSNFQEEFELAKSRGQRSEKVSPEEKKSSSKAAEEKHDVEEVENSCVEKEATEALPVISVDEEAPEDLIAVSSENVEEIAIDEEDSEALQPVVDNVPNLEAPAEELSLDEVALSPEAALSVEPQVPEESLPQEGIVEVEDVANTNEEILADNADVAPLAEGVAPIEVVEEVGETIEVPAEDVDIVKDEVSKQPTAPGKPKNDALLNVPEASNEVPDVEAEEVPLHFHDIEVLQENFAFEEDAKESHKILQSLEQIAARTQVKPPVINKITPQLLEALKANNTTIAKDIEAARAQQNFGAVSQYRSDSARPFTVSKSAPSNTKHYTERFEELKAKVIEQVRFKLKIVNDGKSGKVSIKLKPKYLGNIKVNISLEESQAKARFIVENQTIREILQRSVADLQKALSDHGIDVEAVDIDVADDSHNEAGDHGRSFASAEDQRIAREWLASFYRFDTGVYDQDAPEVSNVVQDDGPDQLLNIVV